MISALLLAAVIGECPQWCPAVVPSASLDPLREAVTRAYRRAGRCVPCEDPALSSAAAQIAEGTWTALPDPVTRQKLVQAAGCGDPAPRALMGEATDAEGLFALVEQDVTPDEPTNVVGFGFAQRERGVRGVVLSAERKVAVDGLPRHADRGATFTIHGRFLAKLAGPAFYVEAPDGTVTEVGATADESGFHGRFVARTDGKYLVEVMARGTHGPEVEFLRPVFVGEGQPEISDLPPAQGTDDEAAVLDVINTERQRYSAAALSPDGRLAQVAQSYAEEMRTGGFFGHVSSHSGDLVSRLTHAHYPYRRAGENLAEGPTALEAHALAANSPAHRKTMLDAQYNRCGIGISRLVLGDGRTDVILVEVFARDQR